MKILNFTQHSATQDQIEAGVIEQPNEKVKPLLNFSSIPDMEILKNRASQIAEIAVIELDIENIDNYRLLVDPPKCMIAGAPYFMAHLERALLDVGIIPVYSFSERVSIEQHNDDGTVSKQNVFKHKGFIEVN